jgi:hypothetical protein
MVVTIFATLALWTQAPTDPVLAAGTQVKMHSVRELRKAMIAPDAPDIQWANLDPARLVLTVDLVGPEMAGAYRYGFITAQGRDNSGSPLQALGSNASGHPGDSFRDVDLEFMFAWQQEKPTDRLRIDLGFVPPARNATHLESVEGTVLVQRADSQQQITFDRIRERRDQTLNHPLLEEAGVTVTVGTAGPSMLGSGDPDKSVSLVINGPMDVLPKIALLKPDGQNISVGRMWNTVAQQTGFVLQAWETLPEDASLQLTVAVGHQTVRVPFQFKNVALP